MDRLSHDYVAIHKHSMDMLFRVPFFITFFLCDSFNIAPIQFTTNGWAHMVGSSFYDVVRDYVEDLFLNFFNQVIIS